MRNIKFNYLYRDAANNKTHGFIVFSNPGNLTVDFIDKEIKNSLIDSEFFDPSEINVPRLIHKDYSYDPELDHAWNQFESIEETEGNADDGRNIEDFLQTISQIKAM